MIPSWQLCMSPRINNLWAELLASCFCFLCLCEAQLANGGFVLVYTQESSPLSVKVAFLVDAWFNGAAE